MTWHVSPEEWLLDFTSVPRGRVRAGESLDAIDDRLRSMLVPLPAGVSMPSLTGRATPRPAGPPARTGNAEVSRPVAQARASEPAPAQPPPSPAAAEAAQRGGLEVERAVGGAGVERRRQRRQPRRHVRPVLERALQGRRDAGGADRLRQVARHHHQGAVAAAFLETPELHPILPTGKPGIVAPVTRRGSGTRPRGRSAPACHGDR